MQFIDLAAQQQQARSAIDAAIGRVLDHGRYVMGPEVAQLESKLSEFCGAPEVVSCSSGTDALVMALLALGVGDGDAVFVPSFTFAATAEAVALLGATPVFVDSEPDTFNLDPKRLADAVDGLDPALRAVGVIPVDLFGLPADYPRLHEVAEANGMWVVADAAQSFGGALGGTDVGRLAPITTTSFFPAKPLGCYGDGGAVFCEDRETAAVLRSLRVHGSGEHKYDNSRIGINGRLDTIQAAILIEKLALFPSELTARQRVADVYRAALSDVARVPEIAPDFRSTWAQYTLRVEAGTRDRLADELGERGVPHAVYYPLPLHLQTAYRGYPRGSGGLPVAEQLAEEVLSLPMHPYLSMGDQEKVIHAVRAALAR